MLVLLCVSYRASLFQGLIRKVHTPLYHIASTANVRLSRLSPHFRIGSLASISPHPGHFRFSNRPFGVKHFQAIHHCSVDVAHGLALLFGIGTKAVPSWDPRTKWNNLYHGLTVRRQVQAEVRTHFIHRPARDIFPLLVELEFPLIGSDPVRVSSLATGVMPGMGIGSKMVANRISVRSN